MSSTFIIGETRRVLASMADASVDLVMSSPPFLALRSYLPVDHPDKALEIGSESGPGEFLDVLLDVVEECARVLTPHGSLVFELGDTYASHDASPGGPNPAYGANRFDERATASAIGPRTGEGWPLQKSLCMIPSTFAWALAYGRNPWTGRETPRWRIRNLVAWCRPNPPVGALGDKFRPGTSYLTVACKARDRWFDLDAVRTTAIDQRFRTTNGPKGQAADPSEVQTANYTTRVPSNEAGAPPLDWWEIPTQPFPGAHYATFPEKLVVRPIEAMCPRQVCRQCGEPRRRIVGDVEYVSLRGASERAMTTGDRRGEGVNQWTAPDGTNGSGWQRQAETVGWSDCGHDDYRRGVVLDPFAGSGTTLAVAEGHGRDSIGIDLDARNADLARARCGEMFLTVETSTEAVA